MKTLVLGGHGFVGKHVMAALRQGGREALALSRRDGLDLADLAGVTACFERERPAVIINCAAHVGSLHYVSENAATVVSDNLRMTLNLYEAARRACPQVKIVNPVSNCSYPGDADIQVESAWWDGPVHRSVWSFANPKRMLVVVSECYWMQHKLPSVNILVPNCYGPGDYTDPNKTHALNGLVIRMLAAKAAAQPRFEIWGTGAPRREWVFVRDLARFMVEQAFETPEQLAPLNLAQNRAYSIRETAEMIRDQIDYQGELTFNPAYQDGAPIKLLDDALFRARHPGFTFTDMARGLEETIAYYRQVLEVAK